MRLNQLATACGTVVSVPGALSTDVDITDITFDSRAVSDGSLFVALAGAQNDGHNYIRKAVGSGAAAVMLDAARAADFATLGVPLLEAVNTRAALGPVAAAFYGNPCDELHVVGVTGTNGKTTVSFLLEAVMLAAGLAPGVVGTVNYRWPGHTEPAPNTTPESLVVQRLLRMMADDGAKAVAMEVSSHGLETHRLTGATFDVALFTNLSQDHLDFHGSMQAYRDAKRRLFTEHLSEDGVAVLNIDDEEGRALVSMVTARTVTVSASGNEADWTCTRFNQELDGTTITASTPHGPIEFKTGLLGAFNVSNVLQTLAGADALGISLDIATAALAGMRGVPGRLQHVGGADRPHVFVDYAHTPDALERALEALRPLTGGSLVAVFGCGGDRDREKRPLMAQAAENGADRVIVTSDNPRTEDPEAILDEIVVGFHSDRFEREVSRAAAIARAVASAAVNDVILVAGKGHETYQEVDGVRRDFDDMDHARRALENWK